MRKALALFMVLIACVYGVFAETKDDVTIKASVTGGSSVAFTVSPYLDSSSELIQGFPEGIDLGDITEGNRTSDTFYVSAKTNKAGALEMKLYGTALTLTEGNALVDGASIDNGNAIELKVEVVTGAISEGAEVINSGITDKNKVSFRTAAKVGTSSTPTEGDQFITFTEGAAVADGDGVPGKGTRALTWALRASADGRKAQAGKYEAYLTLDLTSNG